MSTFVLVHDAWHAGEVWDRVTSRLTAAGHTTYAPSLTGHGDRRHLLGPQVGLHTFIDDVTTVLLDGDLRDVVLVGHGYAGLTIEGVADRVPERIAQLVYLDAVIPADGDTAVGIDRPTAALVDRAARSAEPWRVAAEPPSAGGWFGVTDTGDLDWLRTFVGDESARFFQEPVRIRNPRSLTVSRVHIDCLRGPSPEAARRPLPDRQPNGDPAVVRPLDAAHDCMVTAPDDLVALLLHLRPDPS